MADKVFIIIIAFVVAFAANASSKENAVKNENGWNLDADNNRWIDARKDVNVGESNANNPSKEAVLVINPTGGRKLIRKLESTYPRCHDPNVDCHTGVFDDCSKAEKSINPNICFCVIDLDYPYDYCGMLFTDDGDDTR